MRLNARDWVVCGFGAGLGVPATAVRCSNYDAWYCRFSIWVPPNKNNSLWEDPATRHLWWEFYYDVVNEEIMDNVLGRITPANVWPPNHSLYPLTWDLSPGP